MKILLVTEFFPQGKDLKFSGGVEARTFFVAKNLAKKHTVYVIASRTKGTRPREKLSGIIVHRVGPSRNYSASAGDLLSRMKYINSAISFGSNLNIDIIDSTNYISHFIGRKIAQKKKIPIVAWYPDVWIGSWIKNAGIIGIIGGILERINLSQGFDAYIAISKQTSSKLKPFVKNKVFTIYCGVELKEFSKLAKKFKEPTILCVSRLTKYKNIETLIYAFARLSQSITNANLIIVGQGPQLKNLIGLRDNLKLKSKVRFASNISRNDLVKLYKMSHIFCLPSTVEGFGISTIEAAAAGTPYVNSNISVQKEVTKNGLGGFLVSPNEPISFSNKFLELFKNKNLYTIKSQQARKLAEHYQWADIALETEKIYKSLFNAKN